MLRLSSGRALLPFSQRLSVALAVWAPILPHLLVLLLANLVPAAAGCPVTSNLDQLDVGRVRDCSSWAHPLHSEGSGPVSHGAVKLQGVSETAGSSVGWTTRSPAFSFLHTRN